MKDTQKEWADTFHNGMVKSLKRIEPEVTEIPSIGVLRNQSVMDEKRQRGKGTAFRHFPKVGPGKKCTPTDIDLIIELNGCFLVMEEKHPGQELTTGQKLMLERMTKAYGWIVYVWWGNSDTDTPYATSYVACHNGEWQEPVPATFEDIKALITDFEKDALAEPSVKWGKPMTFNGEFKQ